MISKKTSLEVLIFAPLPCLYRSCQESPKHQSKNKISIFWACIANTAANISRFVCLYDTSLFCSSPLRFGSSLLLISPPELLFDFRWQGVEQVLLHHQTAPLQQPTLPELHWETLKTVPSQLQLGQPSEFSEAWRQRLQAVVSQIQSAQLLALKQLWGQSLNLKRRGQEA